jgi:LacI family transcriptional regulator
MAFREMGVACPDDVSLIGFDDADWAEVVTPPLTVVAQPVYEIGEKACELLLQRIKGEQERPTVVRLPATLILRGSTGPVKASGGGAPLAQP